MTLKWCSWLLCAASKLVLVLVSQEEEYRVSNKNEAQYGHKVSSAFQFHMQTRETLDSLLCWEVCSHIGT